jgi:hypothetical protein
MCISIPELDVFPAQIDGRLKPIIERDEVRTLLINLPSYCTCTISHNLPRKTVQSMILDPLRALDVGGNIVQFVDLSIKLWGK